MTDHIAALAALVDHPGARPPMRTCALTLNPVFSLQAVA